MSIESEKQMRTRPKLPESSRGTDAEEFVRFAPVARNIGAV